MPGWRGAGRTLPGRVSPNPGGNGHPVQCECPACYGPGGHVRINFSPFAGRAPSGGGDHYVAARIVAPDSNPADPRATDATIAGAVAALAGGGGLIYLLEGDHTVAATITLPMGVTIKGANGGAGCRVVAPIANGTPVFSCLVGQNKFEDFELHRASGSNSIGILVSTASGVSCRNIRFVNTGGGP